ncbi:PHB depolymerase family esterase [Ectothiorhodospiraceae bacterium WFHF3C12]|nr:PHB depolymerase family esterase [Ectothiorhodospiraceae bacterium WFHF3C12]
MKRTGINQHDRHSRPRSSRLARTLLAAAAALLTSTALLAANPGWDQETIAGMNVLVYTPDSAPALGDGRALMLTLHGCSQSADDLASAGGWEDTAEEYGMVVAAPDAPNGGVLIGCWDYYGSNHTRGNRHNDNLLGLVDELLGRQALNIDPDQVYISGLSSGGGQVMVMTCLAPDVFAGGGNNAGPTIGTGSGDIGYVATSQSAAVSTCTNLAGSHADAFDTQIASMIYGDGDYTVAQGYNELNADVKAEIYGAGSESAVDMAALPGNSTGGSGRIIADAQGPRVSVIKNAGMGHEWPSGDGTGGNYIAGSSVDYPAYLTAFLFANNRRVDGGDDGGGGTGPSVDITAPVDGATVSGSVTIEASANDDQGVTGVEFYVDDGLLGSDDTEPYSLSWDTTAIGDGDHALKAVALDADGNTGVDDDTTVTVDNGSGGGAEDCWTATNADHYAAGRANQLGTPPYENYNAVGSYQWLGYADDVTSLEETSPGYYVEVGGCN